MIQQRSAPRFPKRGHIALGNPRPAEEMGQPIVVEVAEPGRDVDGLDFD